MTDSPERHMSAHSALLRGLFQELPPEGSVWPTERRELWLACARAAFDSLYEAEHVTPTEAGVTEAPVCCEQHSAASVLANPQENE